MKIEDRIQVTQSNALDVVGLLERELSGRVVFIGRANLLIGIARDVDAVMARCESAGVESDFNADWHMLRERLADSKIQFQRVVSGGDCSQIPCGSNSRAL